ncbi:hypothetical protein ACFV9D_35430 [Streptomyces sp. NPDC059875]|uniref:hypothetical protein n=1 Tax=unclassified Streptomyces TaxID=2593676 RepID=UPI003661F160
MPRRHFPDRQALLDALAEGGFAQLDSVLRTALAGADDFHARARAAMTAYTRFATENPALLELMYTSKHRPGATAIVKAAEAPFALLSVGDRGRTVPARCPPAVVGGHAP